MPDYGQDGRMAPPLNGGGRRVEQAQPIPAASGMYVSEPKTAEAPLEDMLLPFQPLARRLDESAFVQGLIQDGFRLDDGRLVLDFGQYEIVAFPGLEADDDLGAAARIRERGRFGNLSAIAGSYQEVQSAIHEWMAEYGGGRHA